MKTRSQTRASAVPNVTTYAVDLPPASGGGFAGRERVATVPEGTLRPEGAQQDSMPIEDFLQEFLPTTGSMTTLPPLDLDIALPYDADPNSNVPFYSLETTASAVRDAINASGICPTFFFFNYTSAMVVAVPRTLIQDVDIASGTIRVEPRQILPNARVTVEFSAEPDDVATATDIAASYPGAIYDSGQTASITRDTFAQPYRTHLYAIKIFGSKARLLRSDRTGLVVTELFDWRANHGRHLADFLRRLSYANARQKGIEDSVEDLKNVRPEEVTAAVASIKDFTRDILEIAKNTPVCRIKCYDDSALDAHGHPQSRNLIAAYVGDRSLPYPGSFTMNYIAYDVETRRSYLLKDTWAVDSPEHYELEGQTYQKLAAAGVPHILDVECAGVVRWNDGLVQKTRSQDFSASGPLYTRYPRVHYRILFKDIGRPLTSFGSTYELVTIIGQAIAAHAHAYEKAHILHAGVALSKILITRSRKALLVGWDLAIRVRPAPVVDQWGTMSAEDFYDMVDSDSDNSESERSVAQSEWQILSGVAFISGALALSRKQKYRVHHDLESFFWVLLFCLFRYRYAPVRWTVPSEVPALRQYIADLFPRVTDNKDVSDALKTSGPMKLAFLHPQYPHPADKELQKMIDHRTGLMIPPPLALLLCCLRRDFSKVHHAGNLNPTNDIDLLPEFDVTAPGAHGSIIGRFVHAVNSSGWYSDDGAYDRFATPLDIETWRSTGDFSALSRLQPTAAASSSTANPSTVPAAPQSNPATVSISARSIDQLILDHEIFRNPDGTLMPSGRIARKLKNMSSELDNMVREGRLPPADRQQIREFVHRYHPKSGIVAPIAYSEPFDTQSPVHS